MTGFTPSIFLYVRQHSDFEGKFMKRTAFTLIELLVVIAIIAILAAILFPVFAQAKAAAKTSATLSNTKQIATAIQMYAADNDDWTPLPYHGGWYDGWNFRTWVVTTYPYTKNGEIYNDATARPPVTFTSPDVGALNWTGYTTLGGNEIGLFSWWQWTGSTWQFNPGRSLSSQENIADRAAVITTRDPLNSPWGMFIFNNYRASRPVPASVSDSTYFYENSAYAAVKDHANKVIACYADGHSKSVPANKVFKYNATDADWQAAVAQPENEWIKFWGSDRDASR